MNDPVSSSAQSRQELHDRTKAQLEQTWRDFVAQLPPEHVDWDLGCAYVRESGAQSMAGDSPANQLARTLGLLASQRVYVPLEGVFFDQFTGTELVTRGEFQRLLEHAFLGHFKVVGAYLSERLFRNAEDAIKTKREFTKRGIRLEYLGRPMGDERNPANWAAERQQEINDELYARRTSFHIGMAKQHLSQNGRPQGRLPEGYRVAERAPSFMGQPGRIVRYERNEPLASVLVEGAERYRKEGSSFQALADWSRSGELGGVTPNGTPMTAWWWRSSILNPKYAGHHMVSEYTGYKPGKESPKRPRRNANSNLTPCILPPLWSLDDYREMVRLSRSRKVAGKARTGYRISLLSGVAYASCGHRMSVHSREKGRMYMRCGVQTTEGYHGRPIRCDELEHEIDELMGSLVLDDPLLVRMVEEELQRLRDDDAHRPTFRPDPEIAKMRAAIAALGEVAPELTAELRGRISVLELADEARRLERDGQVLEFRRAAAQLRDWHRAWPGASVEAKNAVMHAAGIRLVIDRDEGVPAITELKVENAMVALAVAVAVAAAPLASKRPDGFGRLDANGLVALSPELQPILDRVREERKKAA